MIERAIIAGFGGQGILTAGKLLAECAVREGLNSSYLPSYGSEVRGGTANCNLVVSDEPVCSPVVEEADTLIVMNEASLSRFAQELKRGGLLVANTSLIPARMLAGAGEGRRLVAVDATRLAAELGNVVVANMIMMGAYLAAKPVLPLAAFEQLLAEVLGRRKADLVKINHDAIRLGAAEAGRQKA